VCVFYIYYQIHTQMATISKAPRQTVVAGSGVLINPIDTIYELVSVSAITRDNGIVLPGGFDGQEIRLINRNATNGIAIDQSLVLSRCNIGGTLLSGGVEYTLSFNGGTQGTWNFVGGLPQNPSYTASTLRQETKAGIDFTSLLGAETFSPNGITADSTTNIDVDALGSGDVNIEVADSESINIATDTGTGAVNFGTGASARTINVGWSGPITNVVYAVRQMSRPTRSTSIAANTVLTTAESGMLIPVDTSAGAVTIDLPTLTAFDIGTNYTFYKANADAGSNSWIIDAQPGGAVFFGFVARATNYVPASGAANLLTMGDTTRAYDMVNVKATSTTVWQTTGFQSVGTPAFT
jgi:hypothetical protein